MIEKQGAANCRWAVPTLFLSSPAWADATDRPWSCIRDEEPYELESTDACHHCVRWEPRVEAGASVREDRARTDPFFLDVFSM